MENMDIRILILQRGWVFVGRYSKDGANVVLRNANCVRRWGTSEGIGELALKGPRPDTKLDLAGEVQCHELAVVASVQCSAESWGDIYAA